MKTLYLIIGLIIVAACNNRTNTRHQESIPEDSKSFQVEEVIQASTYTYFKALENSEERWIATAKTDASAGDVYFYEEALQMQDFTSKELNRTFDVIYFINRISKMPISSLDPHNHSGTMPAHSGKVNPEQKTSVTITKDTDETTIAQIFANPSEFTNKQTEIRGVVVKVNKDIMGKNWIHIQDGTMHNNRFDLTITSRNLPTVNEEVTFKGSISLDRDFGSGYFYDVIMEDAERVDKKVAGVRL